MGFGEAVSICVKKYVDFSGRARRSEFWFWVLAVFIADVIVNVIDLAAGTRILGVLLSLATLLPGLAVAARRLHDTGKSAWWLLMILFIGPGWIVLLVFYCLGSTAGDNQYGPNPKGLGGGGYGTPPPGYAAPAPGQAPYGSPPPGYGPPPGFQPPPQ